MIFDYIEEASGVSYLPLPPPGILLLLCLFVVLMMLHVSMSLGLLPRHDFSSVELHEHGAVCFEFFYGDGEAKVVEEEELELKMVELYQRKSADLVAGKNLPVSIGTCIQRYEGKNVTYLGVTGICIKNVGEKFAGTCDTGHDQSMDVEAVYDEIVRDIVGIDRR